MRNGHFLFSFPKKSPRISPGAPKLRYKHYHTNHEASKDILIIASLGSVSANLYPKKPPVP